VDTERSTTNNVHDAYVAGGIELARNVLLREIRNILEHYGHVVNPHHLNLIVDSMTYTGVPLAFTRTGVIKHSKGPLGNACFEQPDKSIFAAALEGRTDDTLGISESIVLGQRCPRLGTAFMDIIVDHKAAHWPAPPAIAAAPMIMDYSGGSVPDDGDVANAMPSAYIPIGGDRGPEPMVLVADDEDAAGMAALYPWLPYLQDPAKAPAPQPSAVLPTWSSSREPDDYQPVHVPEPVFRLSPPAAQTVMKRTFQQASHTDSVPGYDPANPGLNWEASKVRRVLRSTVTERDAPVWPTGPPNYSDTYEGSGGGGGGGGGAGHTGSAVFLSPVPFGDLMPITPAPRRIPHPVGGGRSRGGAQVVEEDEESVIQKSLEQGMRFSLGSPKNGPKQDK
jgi:hypothetical protein